ncbi:DMT family transporter [Sphingomonas sp. LaA6.9]|uniref:DMT family transporter n=1 Tax=Sphingomonas sp. LaA6.9 TaxID=2919914 RepID=UPI001F4FE4C4|nr:DMT family transporter [Sphingomonas sp. LaA6.9]MCJ8157879.1 DMT family transporter [Sphingomonas sp. LaA6.9]
MHESTPKSFSYVEPSPAGRAFVALIGANVCLAFGPWFVRLADVGPTASAFWRMTLAVPFLLIAMRMLGERVPRMGPTLWAMIALSGIFFAGDLATWHLGILKTKLANATLFGNVAILIFPVYGFLVARAWPNRSQAFALLLAAIGGGLLMGRSYDLSAENLAGDLLCLLAGLLYTCYFIVMARARGVMGAYTALSLSTVAGILPLLFFAMLFGETIWPHNWGALLGLAIVSQVIGQGLMIYSLAHFSPLVVGLALLIQPVITATIGWLVYGERLGVPDLIGATFVAIALVLVRRPDRA